MSKMKVRLRYGEMKMLIPLHSTLLFEDLKAEVEKRFKIKATGFVVDSYHISLADEIGDIIENPRDELIDILTIESGQPQPWACSPEATSGEAMVPKTMFEELQKKMKSMEVTLNEYRQGVHLTPQNSVVTVAMPGDALLSRPDNLQSNFFSDNISTNVEAPESLRGSDIEISEHLAAADEQKTNVDERLFEQPIKLEESEGYDSNEAAENSGSNKVSEGSGSNKVSEGSPHPHSVKEDEPEVSPPTQIKEEPKPVPSPDEIRRKKEADDHWAQIEKNLAEKARMKAEAERAAREKEREKRRLVFGSNHPVKKDESKVEERHNAMKEQMMQKMSERLANRKGPRLKLEPTTEKKKKKKKKTSPKSKRLPTPAKDDEELTIDAIEDVSEEEKGTLVSPRSQVAARMAERLKVRKGPRTKLEPTRKPKPKPEPKAKRIRAVSAPKPMVNSSIPGFIDGEMNTRETKRMERMKVEVGDKLEISGHREGIVKFIGETDFSRGVIYGLELCDGSLGENSGTVDDVSYFECRENRGVFIPSKDIRKKFRKPKPKEPCRNVYRRRITRIYEEFNQNKVNKVEGLLDKYEGNEHKLYLNICKKYFVSPEKEYKDK